MVNMFAALSENIRNERIEKPKKPARSGRTGPERQSRFWGSRKIKDKQKS
jgi:hypothetical protein